MTSQSDMSSNSCINIRLSETQPLGQGFPGGSVGNELPTNTEDAGSTLGEEEPLRKAMATYSSNMHEKIPGTGSLVKPQSVGSQRVGHH